ncbi:MAG: aminotransferase class V-fold PLP-dependent enzyme [Gammaproteobacteria bacterium]|nr:aminotransferase class V-fold PLP-dependent enzyme [Gammaproteobacteria bacterium]
MYDERPLIYLDNASTSWPKPPGVYEFMSQFYRSTGVSPGRSGYELAIESGTLLDRLRERLTRFFGGDVDTPERLCFGYNATDALNLIIPGLVAAGEHIVTTEIEHNSVIRPVNHLVRDAGVTATYVPFDAAGFVDPQEIARAIRPNTRLVVINHGSNVIGTVQPVGAIGRVCREHGVPLVVDASQTAGVVPIDMQAMNIDALAFTGHKGLLGSTGIGGLCIRKHLEVRQVRAGGTGVHSEYPYHLAEYPWRLEYGTMNMLGVAALWAGQEWIEQQGIGSIHARELALTERLVAGLRGIDGVRLYCCEDLRDHISTVSMNVAGLDPADTGLRLDVKHNIATRTGLQCAPLVHQRLGTLREGGTVRYSIGPFNTEEHVDAAIRATAEVAAWAAGRTGR